MDLKRIRTIKGVGKGRRVLALATLVLAAVGTYLVQDKAPTTSPLCCPARQWPQWPLPVYRIKDTGS